VGEAMSHPPSGVEGGGKKGEERDSTLTSPTKLSLSTLCDANQNDFPEGHSEDSTQFEALQEYNSFESLLERSLIERLFFHNQVVTWECLLTKFQLI